MLKKKKTQQYIFLVEENGYNFFSVEDYDVCI